MKIKLLTLAFALFIASNAIAQLPTKNEALQAYLLLSKAQRHQLKIKSMIPSGIQIETKKTRSASRLIASASQNLISAVPLLFDSLHYFYNSGYGFDITPKMFAPNIDIASLTSTNKQYYDRSVLWQDDGSGNLTVSDSAFCKFTSNHSLASENTNYYTLPLWSGISYMYNGSGQRILEIDSTIQLPDTFVQKYSLTYDASNHLKTVREDDWDAATSTYIPTFMDTLFYDANFNLITIRDYEYDQSSSSWIKSYLLSMTYNTSNKLISELDQFWEPASSSWENDTKIEYVWNGSNQEVSKTSSNWNSSLTNWVLNEKDSFQYSTSSYPSVKIHQSWNGTTSSLENDMKDEYTYNSSNQILQDHLSIWDGSTLSWIDYSNNNFYYETFIPEGIKETVSASGSMKLFPVPSTGMLHIDGRWNVTQASTLQINDVTGKLMKQMNLPSLTSFSESIDISSLPAGNYILKLHGEKGIMTQLITKQ